jgi:hypothetical protein
MNRLTLRRFLPPAAVLVAIVSFAMPDNRLAAPVGQAGVPLVRAAQASVGNAAPDLRLPLKDNSLRFAVIGDSGTGDREEYEIGRLMELYRQKVGFNFVIMLGDNIYGGHSPADLVSKFAQPFKPLLDAGVKFYATLGNHDDPNVERLYKPFNMDGQRYYAYRKGDVGFFALDSNYMTPEQFNWLESNLKASDAKFKICYFHHPLFNSGKHHGPDMDLRARLLPLFAKYGVNAVFSGHEHVYERLEPVDGVYFFVLGNSGKLMTHDLNNSQQMKVGFDTDRTFGLVEIAGDKLYFQVISRAGKTIDFVELPLAQAPKASAAKTQ